MPDQIAYAVPTSKVFSASARATKDPAYPTTTPSAGHSRVNCSDSLRHDVPKTSRPMAISSHVHPTTEPMSGTIAGDTSTGED